ncbi:MAG: DNA-directed RNA polymerase subunit omega [Thermodesulfobacteriota bacterium]
MARITVEDCLKQVPSRFALVHIAAQRARRLVKGARPLIKCDNKSVVTALREVAEGLVTIETAETEGAASTQAELTAGEAPAAEAAEAALVAPAEEKQEEQGEG